MYNFCYLLHKKSSYYSWKKMNDLKNALIGWLYNLKTKAARSFIYCASSNEDNQNSYFLHRNFNEKKLIWWPFFNQWNEWKSIQINFSCQQNLFLWEKTRYSSVFSIPSRKKNYYEDAYVIIFHKPLRCFSVSALPKIHIGWKLQQLSALGVWFVPQLQLFTLDLTQLMSVYR